MPSPARLLTAAIHAAVAGAFFFLLQRFALGEELQGSIIYAAALAAGAACLSLYQTGR
jgi:putative exporter of polyketide antibiotics